MEYIGLFLRGFGTNVLITVLAALVPIGIGILLSLLTRTNSTFSTIISAINIPFESILIPAAVVVCYYGVARFFRLNFSGLSSVIVVFVLALTYLLYIPAQYNTSYSFGKNALYNGLGLLSGLFKWSFVSFLIGTMDGLNVARSIFGSTYRPWPYLVTFLVAFLILLVVEVARFLVKTFLK